MSARNDNGRGSHHTATLLKITTTTSTTAEAVLSQAHRLRWVCETLCLWLLLPLLLNSLRNICDAQQQLHCPSNTEKTFHIYFMSLMRTQCHQLIIDYVPVMITYLCNALRLRSYRLMRKNVVVARCRNTIMEISPCNTVYCVCVSVLASVYIQSVWVRCYWRESCHCSTLNSNVDRNSNRWIAFRSG